MAALESNRLHGAVVESSQRVGVAAEREGAGAQEEALHRRRGPLRLARAHAMAEGGREDVSVAAAARVLSCSLCASALAHPFGTSQLMPVSAASDIDVG